MEQAAKNGIIGKIAVVRVVALLLLVAQCGCQGQPGPTPSPSAGEEEPLSPAILQSVEYDVSEILTLVNEGSGQPAKQNVWIALIRDIPPYQTVSSREITPDQYQLIVDEHGNRYGDCGHPGPRVPCPDAAARQTRA